MPEEQLDRAQVGAGFKHVSGEAVSQRVGPQTFGDAGAECCFVACIPHGFVRDGLFFRCLFPMAGKQVYARLYFACTPVLAKRVYQSLREWQFPITCSLSLMNM